MDISNCSPLHLNVLVISAWCKNSSYNICFIWSQCSTTIFSLEPGFLCGSTFRKKIRPAQSFTGFWLKRSSDVVYQSLDVVNVNLYLQDQVTFGELTRPQCGRARHWTVENLQCNHCRLWVLFWQTAGLFLGKGTLWFCYSDTGVVYICRRSS